jgi:hypothetical protein
VLMKRDEGGAFDNLAMGLDSGAITRGRAIKLAGAALLSGALGIFAASPAEATGSSCGCNRRCTRRCERNGGTVCCRNGRSFCCPKAKVQLTSCGAAILDGFCLRVL